MRIAGACKRTLLHLVIGYVGVADQWYWSFNSANVATVEAFHVRLNESVTLKPSTHHTHTQSFSSPPLFLSRSYAGNVQ